MQRWQTLYQSTWRYNPEDSHLQISAFFVNTIFTLFAETLKKSTLYLGKPK
jgi:hypothetical protein